MTNWKTIALLVVACCALNIATMWMARWAAGVDSDALTRASIEVAFAQRATPPTEEQAAAAATFMGPMIKLYPVMAIVTTILWLLVITTIFFVAFRLLDEAPSWTTVLAAVAIAAVCQAAATLLLTGAAVASEPPTASELLRGTFLVTNVAALLPEGSAVPLIALARRFDVLTLIFLIVLGVTIADRMPPKASRGAIAGVIAGCFALWTGGALVVAFVMPSMVMR